MVYVTGYNTTIVRALSSLDVGMVNRLDVDLNTFDYSDYVDRVPTDSNRFVLCAGALLPKTLLHQTPMELMTSVSVNMLATMALSDAILRKNKKARIVVVGSASGVAGSYDGAYASSKAGIHQYVRTKKLEPDQQLVAVAPSIIWDSGMTERRDDQENLLLRKDKHPKGRFLSAIEVAELIHYLLYVDRGYITNTVINISGGEFRW